MLPPCQKAACRAMLEDRHHAWYASRETCSARHDLQQAPSGAWWQRKQSPIDADLERTVSKCVTGTSCKGGAGGRGGAHLHMHGGGCK
jgi:hypothetical protein